MCISTLLFNKQTMTTIINDDPVMERRTTIDRRTDSSPGWAVAVIILIALLVIGGIMWMRNRGVVAPENTGGNSINVTLPAASGNTGTPAPSDGTSAGTGY